MGGRYSITKSWVALVYCPFFGWFFLELLAGPKYQHINSLWSCEFLPIVGYLGFNKEGGICYLDTIIKVVQNMKKKARTLAGGASPFLWALVSFTAVLLCYCGFEFFFFPTPRMFMVFFFVFFASGFGQKKEYIFSRGGHRPQ